MGNLQSNVSENTGSLAASSQSTTERVADPFSTYSFVVPLITEFLSDKDTLNGLLITNRSINELAKTYRLKSSLSPFEAHKLLTGRGSPVIISRLHEVTDHDNLSSFPSLHEISFLTTFDKPIRKGFLLDTLTSVTFGRYFNQPICPDVLPRSLTYLALGDRFNQHLISLPPTLTHLIVGNSFNQPLDAVTLTALKQLELGECFTQIILPNVLPNTVTHVTFGNRYNQPLTPGSIPCNVTHLKFGRNFSWPLDNDILPDSITHLWLGWKYRSPLKPPPKLVHITVANGKTYESLVCLLPSTLTSLAVDMFPDFDQHVVDIPTTIKHLKLPRVHRSQCIPCSVTHLEFGLTFDDPLVPGMLPEGIVHLDFGPRFNQPIDHGVIPASVTNLVFSNMFNQPIEPGVLPSSLKHVHFGRHFNQPLKPGSIPDSTLSITFSLLRNPPIAIAPTRAEIRYISTAPSPEPRISRWMMQLVWLLLWLDYGSLVRLPVIITVIAIVVIHWSSHM